VEEASSAYGAEMWHELYVMVGGAAGALAGLLFVAVSINLILALLRTAADGWAISLLVGAGGGLYWFVLAVVLGFAGAVLNA